MLQMLCKIPIYIILVSILLLIIISLPVVRDTFLLAGMVFFFTRNHQLNSLEALSLMKQGTQEQLGKQLSTSSMTISYHLLL